MTSRDRITLSVLIAVFTLAGFYMLALKPKRQEAAKLNQQLAQSQQRADTARSDLAAGIDARSTYSANYATVARLGKAVPTDDDIPSLVFQLDSTAEATGVDFRSVKLTSGSGASAAPPANSAGAAAATSDQASGDAKSGDAPKPEDGAAANPAPPTTGTTTTTTGTTASPAAPTQAATAALPPGAVVGPAGLSTMPFSFSFEGSFFKLSDFLTKLERYIKPTRESVRVRGRLLLVDGIALTAAGDGFPKMKASIAATAYLLPTSQGLFDGASPQGPSASTATPVSAGSPGTPTPPATVTP